MYRNRADAGRKLVERLRERIPTLESEDCVVLGVAPGGLIVAREVALALRAPLDVVVALRLPAPGYDDLGIGGVAPGGVACLDERTMSMLGVKAEYVAATVRALSTEAERLTMSYRGTRQPVRLAGRRAIVIDDGAQTRYRSRAAVGAARAAGAREVVFAVPVAASDVLNAIAQEADAVVFDLVPERYCGIGAYYSDSDQPRLEDIRAIRRRATMLEPRAPQRRRTPTAELL